MRQFVLILGCIANPLWAQDALAPPKTPTPNLVREDWQVASIDGQRSGYTQFTILEYDVNGTKYYRAASKLSLTLKRFGDKATVEAIAGTDETADGKVTGIFMQQGPGKSVDLRVEGRIENGKLNVVAQGAMKFEKSIPWSPEVVGKRGELQYVGKLKPEPGKSFEYLIYEPMVNSIVKVKARAEAYEKVTFGQKEPTLLKVITEPVTIGEITLPGATTWYDKNYLLVKSETVMPGIGRVTFEAATREAALQPCEGPDLGWSQSIRLKQRLTAPHDSASVTYRIALTDKDPLKVFAADNRQTVKLVNDKTLELTIQPVRRPPPVQPAVGPPGKEFLTSNYFLTSDDPTVRSHASKAVGAEADPWKKAQLIERWVYTNMRVMNFTEAMAPASQVARNLSGDCTEYSMLAAAMCRAAGVPSRTAIGLVYVDARDGRAAMFAMHMWTEVWVNGQWLALDATLGRGSVGAAHIKVTDHSWHEIATMTPLMPLMRLNMSQPKIEIVKELGTLP